MNPVDPRDPSRNLLFGLLAFQNNFIDRRALLAAFDAWTADKSRPLGRVLAEQGAITDDLLTLIDGLVAAHLRRHDDEPSKSLAALTPIGSLLKDLEARADPESRVTLSHVSEEPSNFGSNSTIFESVGDATSTGMRFRILRPLNRGGMGVVSVALDTELDRAIALKEIRDTAAHDAGYRARFLAEAEITGKLEHPGIIPIYGLGTYADGRPFYAMRLIRGDKTGSLMDAIERFHKEPDPASRAVEFRGLLRRFLDVCNALSYAHSKGVLHRDLKPDNILLGPYGETLVVDWGLAKAAGRADPVTSADGEQVRLNLSGSELSPTLAGGAMGTPGYAPPEQMTGDLANIGPRSDVYGLGAVLYCLMTGRAPFSRKGIDLGQLIQKIEAGDFPPPRQVRAEADKPLEAICLKAMSRKAADRYESVASLAAEIERYLADEPVSVLPERWTTRLARWTRRHRSAALAGAASLAVVAVTASIASLVIAKALSDRTRAFNDKSAALAEKSRALVALAAALEAKTKSLEAETAANAKTQATFKSAKSTIDEFVRLVRQDHRLRDDPSLRPFRDELIEKVLAYTLGFIDQYKNDPLLAVETSSAYLDAGYLHNEIGRKADAIRAFEASLRIRETPGLDRLDDASRALLARTLTALGLLQQETGLKGAAGQSCTRAIELYEGLVGRNPAASDFADGLAGALNNLGEIQGSSGRIQAAEQSFARSIEVYEGHLKRNPGAVEVTNGLGRVLNNFGLMQSDHGRDAPAERNFLRAIELLGPLVERSPETAAFADSSARALVNLGRLQRRAGRDDDAERSYTRAIEVFEPLGKHIPEVTDHAHILAQALVDLGKLQSGSGRNEAAGRSFARAIELYEVLVKRNPEGILFSIGLAGTVIELGTVLRALGERDDAGKAYASALAIHQKLALDHPESPDFASDLAVCLNNLASIDMDAGRFAEARARYREAIDSQRKAEASNPANPAYRRLLALHLANLIICERSLGDPEGVAEAEGELAKLRDSDAAMAALDARLAAVLKGDQEPKGNSERLALAQKAHDKKLHATAARLWAEALAADPKLGGDRQAGHRYNAACAASLAGSGQGKDDPRPDDAAKAKLRGQAQTWLKAELSAWKRVAMTVGPGNKELVARTLKHWKEDADLAGVREAAALDKLPEAERTAWQALWADVDGLLKKVIAH